MNDEDLLRYSRHILLPQIDLDGQEKLLASHVAIIGVGGLGSPVALYLAAAGVGHLTLVDHDHVDLGNLQRQIAHGEGNLNEQKTASAKARLRTINSTILIDTVPKKLSEAEIFELTDRASVVVDCTDNFETRHLVNRACVLSRTPLVSAAAIRFEGQLMVWDPVVEGSPCYACLYPVDQPVDINCATTGVAAPLVGVMGSLQAMETIKVILGIASEHTGRLTTYDGLHSDWQTFRFKKRADCPACGEC